MADTTKIRGSDLTAFLDSDAFKNFQSMVEEVRKAFEGIDAKIRLPLDTVTSRILHQIDEREKKDRSRPDRRY